MSDFFQYKGYLGSAEIDIENRVLVGRLLFIRDAIAYSAADPTALETAFREAVDDYLATCEAVGDEPDTPCKGTFNVRIAPQLHRSVAVAAKKKGQGLNDFVTAALEVAVDEHVQAVQHNHTHTHRVTVSVDSDGPRNFFVSTGKDSDRTSYATAH